MSATTLKWQQAAHSTRTSDQTCLKERFPLAHALQKEGIQIIAEASVEGFQEAHRQKWCESRAIPHEARVRRVIITAGAAVVGLALLWTSFALSTTPWILGLVAPSLLTYFSALFLWDKRTPLPVDAAWRQVLLERNRWEVTPYSEFLITHRVPWHIKHLVAKVMEVAPAGSHIEVESLEPDPFFWVRHGSERYCFGHDEGEF